MVKMKKWLDSVKNRLYEEDFFKDTLSILFFLSLSLYNACTGYFLMYEGNIIAKQSHTYALMQKIMSLDAWGMLFLASSVLILASAFMQENKGKYICMILGGLAGAILLFLYAAASAERAVTMMVPIRAGLSGCFNLFIAVLGGVELWEPKQKKQR